MGGKKPGGKRRRPKRAASQPQEAPEEPKRGGARIVAGTSGSDKVGSVRALAEALKRRGREVSVDTVRRMRDRGEIHAGPDGKLSVAQAEDALDYRESRRTNGSGGSSALADAERQLRIERERLRLQKEQIEMGQFSGRLVIKAEVKAGYSFRMSELIVGLKNVGREVAGRVVGRGPREAERLITECIFAKLEKMVDGDLYTWDDFQRDLKRSLTAPFS